MGNIQGRKHRRRRSRKLVKPKKEEIKVVCDKLVFIDRDDGEFVWENHVYGRLPFKEPHDPEIVFYGEHLWQDDNDAWSMIVLMGDEINELSDVELEDFQIII